MFKFCSTYCQSRSIFAPVHFAPPMPLPSRSSSSHDALTRAVTLFNFSHADELLNLSAVYVYKPGAQCSSVEDNLGSVVVGILCERRTSHSIICSPSGPSNPPARLQSVTCNSTANASHKPLLNRTNQSLTFNTRRVSCIVYRVSCIVYRVSCIVYRVPCIVYYDTRKYIHDKLI